MIVAELYSITTDIVVYVSKAARMGGRNPKQGSLMRIKGLIVKNLI